ncbi:hypothetical protein D046_6069B, partial [Vibrio parahaemolyticus V-223/04]
IATPLQKVTKLK